MPDIEDFQAEVDKDKDDAQSGLNKWQKSLLSWQWPLAFGPFILVITLAQVPISNSIPTGLFVGLIMAAVVWAVAFKGYLLYLNYQK